MSTQLCSCQNTPTEAGAGCKNVTTIRTTSIVSQQQRQRLAQNFMREQMNNYKQMRRQHYRQLQQVISHECTSALFGLTACCCLSGIWNGYSWQQFVLCVL